jgi:ornithine--oxo-acid transaminase
MIGVELFPEAGGARPYCEKLMSLGILCKETHDTSSALHHPLSSRRPRSIGRWRE